jgi:hypothetical protein
MFFKRKSFNDAYQFSILGNNIKLDDHGVTCPDFRNSELIYLWQSWRRTSLWTGMYYWQGINMGSDELSIDFPVEYDIRSYKLGKSIKCKSFDHQWGYSGFMGGGYTTEKLKVCFEVSHFLFKTIYEYKLIIDALNTKTMYGELYRSGNLVERSRPRCLYIGEEIYV